MRHRVVAPPEPCRSLRLTSKRLSNAGRRYINARHEWLELSVDSRKFDLDIHYIQIGGVKEFKIDRVRPFGTLGLGASGFVPKNDRTLESWWSFAINFGAGVKINISESIGIRLQARMLMPLYFSGAGIFCSTGGCGGGLTASSNVIQGDFMGGLVFGF